MMESVFSVQTWMLPLQGLCGLLSFWCHRGCTSFLYLMQAQSGSHVQHLVTLDSGGTSEAVLIMLNMPRIHLVLLPLWSVLLPDVLAHQHIQKIGLAKGGWIWLQNYLGHTSLNKKIKWSQAIIIFEAIALEQAWLLKCCPKPQGCIIIILL